MARRHRSSSRAFLLFNSDVSRGWNVTRRIDFHRGEQMVDLGTAVKVFDAMKVHVGYRILAESERTVKSPSQQSAICISASELRAAVGLCGRSATKGRSDEFLYSRTDRRSGKALPVEDFIERAEGKLLHYPSIFDVKAPLAVGRYA